MSVTIQNQNVNDRGLYFEFTGDGATTVLPVVPVPDVYFRPITVTATPVTSATPSYDSDGVTGLLAVHTGVAVAVASATYSPAGIAITLSAAVANGTQCYVEVVFNSDMA